MQRLRLVTSNAILSVLALAVCAPAGRTNAQAPVYPDMLECNATCQAAQRAGLMATYDSLNGRDGQKPAEVLI